MVNADTTRASRGGEEGGGGTEALRTTTANFADVGTEKKSDAKFTDLSQNCDKLAGTRFLNAKKKKLNEILRLHCTTSTTK